MLLRRRRLLLLPVHTLRRMIRILRYQLTLMSFDLPLYEFMLNNAFSEDLAEGSKAEGVEVISLSSDSEPLPPKIRRVSRKYPFSHPYAQLDPNFLLKK